MITTLAHTQWQHRLSLPLARRIGPATNELIDYVNLVNQACGNPGLPVSITPPPDFENDVKSAIGEMPQAVLRLLESSLLGVFFANDLGSSAITDVMADAEGNVLGAVVVLDVAAFIEKSANEWATWKENTPFIALPPMTLEAAIASPAYDTRRSAIQYLLLHEFGHVLTACCATLPNWWETLPDLRGDGLVAHPWPFFDLNWQMTDDGQILPTAGHDFALRRYVAYYSGANLSTDDLLSVYAALEQTSFATLYAATNVYDDFAETFANYVHVVLMQRHYQLRILCDKIALFEPEPFWQSERGRAKAQYMQAFLALDGAVPALPLALAGTRQTESMLAG
jgi:hypothetical protein